MSEVLTSSNRKIRVSLAIIFATIMLLFTMATAAEAAIGCRCHGGSGGSYKFIYSQKYYRGVGF